MESCNVQWRGDSRAARRKAVRRLSVGKTSFRRRHRYEGLGEKYRAAVEGVRMDMWGLYISASLAMIPDAMMKIAFDRFHVAKHLGDLVDQGPAGGAPGAGEGGQRHPGGHQVAVAEEPQTEDARRKAGVR